MLLEQPEATSPIVHMNGTSADRLMESLSDVCDAAQKTYEALKQAAPNGRDYYQEPGRMEKAEAQHRWRMMLLDALQKSVEQEMDAIANQ